MAKKREPESDSSSQPQKTIVTPRYVSPERRRELLAEGERLFAEVLKAGKPTYVPPWDYHYDQSESRT